MYKYEQEHFTVLIVEYIDIKNLTILETNYMTKLLSYYNVLKQDYSSLGYKHTEKTRLLLSKLAKK